MHSTAGTSQVVLLISGTRGGMGAGSDVPSQACHPSHPQAALPLAPRSIFSSDKPHPGCRAIPQLSFSIHFWPPWPASCPTVCPSHLPQAACLPGLPRPTQHTAAFISKAHAWLLVSSAPCPASLPITNTAPPGGQKRHRPQCQPRMEQPAQHTWCVRLTVAIMPGSTSLLHTTVIPKTQPTSQSLLFCSALLFHLSPSC